MHHSERVNKVAFSLKPNPSKSVKLHCYNLSIFVEKRIWKFAYLDSSITYVQILALNLNNQAERFGAFSTRSVSAYFLLTFLK